ncbi:DUF4279 domain-containing protein [Luteibacter anthropi]|uniref:DUF4279 domain-containing protein n=1 Tax=Luteibacter anthropi TaxID=564369 RepID=UPI002032E9DA|nr:DUF4279 domain-containing protein [Luteibacter anthropi]URX62825.1 DUF4279 domain-containing protein [Luteibacter anthropi]
MTDASLPDADLRQRAPRVRASFRLTSDRHLVDHLKDQLGLEAAHTWQKGDLDDTAINQRRAHGWCLRMPEQRTYTTDTALRELLDALRPRQDEIVTAIKALELDAHFHLDVEVHAGHLPACFWSDANIRAVAIYGASLHAQLIDAPAEGRPADQSMPVSSLAASDIME